MLCLDCVADDTQSLHNVLLLLVSRPVHARSVKWFWPSSDVRAADMSHLMI